MSTADKLNVIPDGSRWSLQDRYHPVELSYFTIDLICPLEIYIRVNDQFVLFRKANLPFTQEVRSRLVQSNIANVYILVENERQVRDFYEKNLSSIIDNGKISVEKKASVLYQCASGITQDIFENPENKENIGRSRDVVSNTLSLLAQSSDAFVQIISLSAHDYYTYAHCVNVMTFSLSLLSSLGIKDPRVTKEVGMGALLHDIGKAKVPHEVLNKPGPLTDDEWKIMKQHPTFGHEMLKGTSVPEKGKQVVVQHHERINGMGYPYGLKGDQLPLISQVVSLCDAYDAMTSTRIYKAAMKPFTAFKIISNEMKGHFDPLVVQKFIELLNLKARKE